MNASTAPISLHPAGPTPAPPRAAARPSPDGFTFWGLLFCLIIQYVQIGKQIPPLEALRPFLLSVLVVAAAWIFEAAGGRSRPVVTGPQTWAFVAFLVMTALSVPAAFNSGKAYEAFVLMTKFFAVYFLIINIVDSPSKFRKVIYGLIAVHFYIAARGIVSAVRNPSDREAVGAAFFLGDSNDFAMVLTMMLPFAYFLLPTQRTVLSRVALVAAGLTFVLATIFTSSRGGTIALLAVLAYCVLSSRRKAVAIGLTVILLTIAAVAAPASYWERIQTIWEPKEEDTSSRIRLEAWRAAIQMALDYPLVGVGATNFGHAKGLFYRTEGVPGENWNWVSAHSIYFGTLAEQGFPGLGLLLLMMTTMFRATRRAQRLLRHDTESFLAATSKALGGSVLAFAVAGTFIGNTYHPVPWDIAAFTVVAQNLARQVSDRTVRPMPPRRDKT